VENETTGLEMEIITLDRETKWYDAWIRWERGSKETYDEEEEEEDAAPLVPPDTYTFRYGNVSVELQGFPAEAEAIWSSTGLTL